MEKFKCHKIVEAAKIEALILRDNFSPSRCWMRLSDDAFSRYVTFEWHEKHKPVVGGYFVRYEDGYESFSPADAFEAGYAKLSDNNGEEPCCGNYALCLKGCTPRGVWIAQNRTGPEDGPFPDHRYAMLVKEFLYTAQQICSGAGDQQALIRHLAKLGERIEPKQLEWMPRKTGAASATYEEPYGISDAEFVAGTAFGTVVPVGTPPDVERALRGRIAELEQRLADIRNALGGAGHTVSVAERIMQSPYGVQADALPESKNLATDAAASWPNATLSEFPWRHEEWMPEGVVGCDARRFSGVRTIPPGIEYDMKRDIYLMHVAK